MNFAIAKMIHASVVSAGLHSWARIAQNRVDIRDINSESDRTEEAMRKAKAVVEMKIERPPRAVVTKKEALKRMKEFSNRKEKFIATVRTSKSGSVRP